MIINNLTYNTLKIIYNFMHNHLIIINNLMYINIQNETRICIKYNSPILKFQEIIFSFLFAVNQRRN